MAPIGIGRRFGATAVEKGFVTPDQVIEALAIQARENVEERRNRPIGEILTALGYIKTTDVSKVLEGRFERRFGDIAVTGGFISLGQLVEAMTLQVREETGKGVHRLLGELLMDLDYMTETQVRQVLREMGKE
jgi:hypothetical protein